jgi:hypothetical protein
MVLTYILCSALAVVAAAHSGSLSAHVPETMCSGPCHAQSKEELVLVQRFASVAMKDAHQTVQDLSATPTVGYAKKIDSAACANRKYDKCGYTFPTVQACSECCAANYGPTCTSFHYSIADKFCGCTNAGEECQNYHASGHSVYSITVLSAIPPVGYAKKNRQCCLRKP